ncbi:MAG: putative cytochrome c oxidase subunit [Acidimicrobiales bacterium]|nr:putative cytochrome c oxidase subunit [Acidimicrobiales bacterium]
MAAVEVPTALPPAPGPARPRLLIVGTSLAIAATLMVFAGLIGLYLQQRAEALATSGTWLPQGAHIPLTPGSMSLFTLLLSVVTMWWAVDAVGRNDRASAYFALALTIMFGACVINATSFLYANSNLHVDTVPGMMFFTITGAHLAMLVVAMVFNIVMVIRTLGGEYQGRDREGLVAAAMFWYATVAVYTVIWYAIYVTK